MSDYAKLKELAEDAVEQSDNIGEAAWYTADCLQHLLSAGAPDAEFIAATNPAVVLGLIADYEKASKHWANDSNNVQALYAELLRVTTQRNAAQTILKKFVDGEHDHDENQADRHMYFTDAESLLALIGGELAEHTLVPDMTLKAMHEASVALKAECEGLREVMACVVSEIPRGYSRGNAPGHCHDIPGIWDRDNGDKAGKECGWCKVWNAAIALSKGERP